MHRSFVTLAAGAAALILATANVQASVFIGATGGVTSATTKADKSLTTDPTPNRPNYKKLLNKDATWGIRAGTMGERGRSYLTYERVTDSSRGLKLKQENVLASYDLLLPVNDVGTQLFGGASAGVTRVAVGGNYRPNTAAALTYGLQAGVLQGLGEHASIEGGYRYLRSNASVDIADKSNCGCTGSLSVRNSGQLYVGVNYRF